MGGRLYKEIKKTILIGSCHSSIESYKDILHSNQRVDTVQLGDFGFREDHEWHENCTNNSKNKILFGNNDDLNYLGSKYSLGDFGMHNGMFFVRGAQSRDRIFRTLDVDYFEREELSFYDMQQCSVSYATHKPYVVISHECPSSVSHHFADTTQLTPTNKFLDRLLEIHIPSMFIFSHYGISKSVEVGNTIFKSLGELEVFNIGSRKF